MYTINLPPVVKNLLIINVLMFVATWVLANANFVNLDELLSVHYFNSPEFKIWQPITYLFMHSQRDIGHIIFNMIGLLMFGRILETYWGSKRFLNFYLITGIGAVVFQWALQAFELYQITGTIVDNGQIGLEALANQRFNPQQFSMSQASQLYAIFFGTMQGASGAIFGLSAAIAMLFPNFEFTIMPFPVPIKAIYIVPVYVAMEVYLGIGRFADDNVAHFAHIGGAVIGFLLVKFWRNKSNFFDYYE